MPVWSAADCKRVQLSGSILVNGDPRTESTWKKTVAFVEQDDLMLHNLSVRETLMYAAMLRLPSSVSKEDKANRVEKIIEQLGLKKCGMNAQLNVLIGLLSHGVSIPADSWIGSVDTARGISGGERKRVSIGIELVTDPSLLFLDEVVPRRASSLCHSGSFVLSQRRGWTRSLPAPLWTWSRRWLLPGTRPCCARSTSRTSTR